MQRRVLVTGASGGIGRAIAIKLAEDGFEIVVHYGRNEDAGRETIAQVEAVGGEASLIQFDVSNRVQCRDILESHIAEKGSFYGIILNAGITRDTAFPAMTDEDWDDVIHTNLDGFYNVLRPTTLPMVSARKGGRIVVLSSLSGVMGNRGQVNYSASKSGLIGATKALSLELAKRKITVNSVAPGLIETSMTDDLPMEEIMKMIPLRRVGTPDEVAATVSFLCSDGAGYITRQVISVNGGMA
ncbi:MAG: 3-ketoacyl-ACP reductase FabG2 [Sneathiella sp.]|uniref:3-ketoacyl-ACP reductase FabG2 n=1 Tax=Sneathiella sp. TaxID=1964365 RepID=UPI0030018FAA